MRRPKDLAANGKNVKAEAPPIEATAAPVAAGQKIVTEKLPDGSAVIARVLNEKGEVERQFSGKSMESLRDIMQKSGALPKGQDLPEPLPPPVPEEEPVKPETEHGLLEGKTYTAHKDDPSLGINAGDKFIYRGYRNGKDWFVQVDEKGNRKSPTSFEDAKPELKKIFTREE